MSNVSFILGRLSTAEKLQLQFAAAIVASDEAEEILLYADAKPGEIVVVELEPDQVLFEGPELYELACVVKRIKGSCLLSLEHPPVAIECDSEPAGRTDSSLPDDPETLLSDDDGDDEPANWWKRGDQ